MSKNVQTTKDALILSKAVKRAAEFLGVSKDTLSSILSIQTSQLEPVLKLGIDPKTKQGERSLIFINVYTRLAALSGGDEMFIKHFMQTDNRYFEAKPIDVMKSAEGLERVHHYLIAMGSKH